MCFSPALGNKCVLTAGQLGDWRRRRKSTMGGLGVSGHIAIVENDYRMVIHVHAIAGYAVPARV